MGEAPPALERATAPAQASLAALVRHLQRLQCAHHLAGGAALVSSYEVRGLLLGPRPAVHWKFVEAQHRPLPAPSDSL